VHRRFLGDNDADLAPESSIFQDTVKVTQTGEYLASLSSPVSDLWGNCFLKRWPRAHTNVPDTQTTTSDETPAVCTPNGHTNLLVSETFQLPAVYPPWDSRPRLGVSPQADPATYQCIVPLW